MPRAYTAVRVGPTPSGSAWPGRAVVPWAGLAVAALLAPAVGLPVRACLAAAAGAALVGAVRGGLDLRERWASRRAADAVLRTGAHVHPLSTLLTWRAGELVSARHRRTLARSLRSIVRELERPTRSLTFPVPLNRREARPNVELLRSLADRLEHVGVQVMPHGVVLIEDLLSDGLHSPLYAGNRASTPLRPALEACLAALGRAPAARRPAHDHLSSIATPDVFDPSEADAGSVSAQGGGTH